MNEIRKCLETLKNKKFIVNEILIPKDIQEKLLEQFNNQIGVEITGCYSLYGVRVGTNFWTNSIEFCSNIKMEDILKADEEIKRLKEEYVMLQNASDEVEEELQQRIDKALSYLRDIGNWLRDDSSYRAKLIDILQGSDKE